VKEEIQLGLMFEMEQERLEEEPELPIEIAANPEQPALFEGIAAPVNANPEPEIPWAEYVRQAQLFFNQNQFEEFKENVSRLAIKYGTKNVTDTVAEAMRRAN
jgi:hypothetical protein